VTRSKHDSVYCDRRALSLVAGAWPFVSKTEIRFSTGFPNPLTSSSTRREFTFLSRDARSPLIYARRLRADYPRAALFSHSLAFIYQSLASHSLVL